MISKTQAEKLTPEQVEIMSEPVADSGNKMYVVEEKDEPKDTVDLVVAESKDVKKPEVKSEVKEEPKEDFFDKMERELSKPEGKEDLTEFTTREKAYYHSMRSDRKKRQKAEVERDEALFREMKLKKEKEKPEVVEDDDPFKDRAPDDLLTVEDIKKLLAKKEKKEEPKVENQVLDVQNPTVKKFIALCDQEARQTYPDYEEVVELANEIISNNPKYQEDIANCFHRGENPAIRMYELIKSDAEFEKLIPVAQTRVNARKVKTDKPAVAVDKNKKAQEVQEAIEKNKTKTKTSAHAVGSEDNSGELTLEEINKMPSREFAKLPKKQRDKILQLYGG